MGPGHPIEASHAQRLKSKQPTLVTGRRLNCPGPEPKEPSERAVWKVKADKFAKHALCMFQPEPDLYEKTQTNKLEHTWDALQEWILSLRQDGSILSSFRLKSMQNYLHSMSASYDAKKVLSHCRARCRDEWTDKDYEASAAESAMQANIADGNALDDCAFERSHGTLTLRATRDAAQQIQHCRNQAATLNNIHELLDKTTSPTRRVRGNPIWSHTSPIIDAADKYVKLVNSLPLKPETSSNGATVLLKGNSEQNRIVETFKAMLGRKARGLSNDPLLITGGPGIGKSHLVKLLQQEAKKQGKVAKTTSFNGIAVVNVNGCDTVSGLIGANWSTSDQRAPKMPCQLKEWPL